MNKAVLVIDMPECCDDCKLSDYSDSWELYCCYTGEAVDKIKPDWCPLKPVPKKVQVMYGDDSQDWDKGYNSCVEEIMDE